MIFFFLWRLLHYLVSLYQPKFYLQPTQQFTLTKMSRSKIFRLLCFDAQGCYEGEWNRWPRDSIVWFRPIVYPYKVKASIVRQEKNYLICDVDVNYNDLLFPECLMGRVKVHKREIMDILTAPHFHYGKVGDRENFEMPRYSHYRGRSYVEPVYSTPT